MLIRRIVFLGLILFSVTGEGQDIQSALCQENWDNLFPNNPVPSTALKKAAVLATENAMAKASYAYLAIRQKIATADVDGVLNGIDERNKEILKRIYELIENGQFLGSKQEANDLKVFLGSLKSFSDSDAKNVPDEMKLDDFDVQALTTFSLSTKVAQRKGKKVIETLLEQFSQNLPFRKFDGKDQVEAKNDSKRLKAEIDESLAAFSDELIKKVMGIQGAMNENCSSYIPALLKGNTSFAVLCSKIRTPADYLDQKFLTSIEGLVEKITELDVNPYWSVVGLRVRLTCSKKGDGQYDFSGKADYLQNGGQWSLQIGAQEIPLENPDLIAEEHRIETFIGKKMEKFSLKSTHGNEPYQLTVNGQDVKNGFTVSDEVCGKGPVAIVMIQKDVAESTAIGVAESIAKDPVPTCERAGNGFEYKNFTVKNAPDGATFAWLDFVPAPAPASSVESYIAKDASFGQSQIGNKDLKVTIGAGGISTKEVSCADNTKLDVTCVSSDGKKFVVNGTEEVSALVKELKWSKDDVANKSLEKMFQEVQAEMEVEVIYVNEQKSGPIQCQIGLQGVDSFSLELTIQDDNDDEIVSVMAEVTAAPSQEYKIEWKCVEEEGKDETLCSRSNLKEGEGHKTKNTGNKQFSHDKIKRAAKDYKIQVVATLTEDPKPVRQAEVLITKCSSEECKEKREAEEDATLNRPPGAPPISPLAPPQSVPTSPIMIEGFN